MLTQPINKGSGPTQALAAEGLLWHYRERQEWVPASQLAFASPDEMVSTSPTPDSDLELPQATEVTATDRWGSMGPAPLPYHSQGTVQA